MNKNIRFASNESAPEISLMDKIGTGIAEARSADYLIKACGFSDEAELSKAVAFAWSHKMPVLQYKGKFFVAANEEELAKYICRQCDANGNPVIEYR